jgi:hypothetical protein
MNFFNFIASALVLGHVMAVSGDPSSITIRGGGYSGTCTNQTYGITARLRLEMHEESGTVSGNLAIAGKLDGGGPITGTLEGDQLTFTSRASYCEITWFGRMKGKTIKGTYRVQLEDGSTQKGIWSVSRE